MAMRYVFTLLPYCSSSARRLHHPATALSPPHARHLRLLRFHRTRKRLRVTAHAAHCQYCWSPWEAWRTHPSPCSCQRDALDASRAAALRPPLARRPSWLRRMMPTSPLSQQRGFARGRGRHLWRWHRRAHRAVATGIRPLPQHFRASGCTTARQQRKGGRQVTVKGRAEGQGRRYREGGREGQVLAGRDAAAHTSVSDGRYASLATTASARMWHAFAGR